MSGEAVSYADLARLCGAGEAQFKAFVGDLLMRGVLAIEPEARPAP